MDGVETRLANPADITNIAELLSSTFYQYHGWRSLFTPLLRLGLCYDLASRLQSPNPLKYQCLVAEAPHPTHTGIKLVVGTVEIGLRSLALSSLRMSPKAYISNLAVQSHYRQQGIGRLLLRRCENIAKNWQQQEIFLHVRTDNTVAKALYQKLGYHSSSSRSPLEMQRCLLSKQI